MGAVYCARDERLGRDVAIKLLRSDLASDVVARQRFLREGQIAGQIVHPNVVRTYDAGDDPAGPYLVQEFLEGTTLDQAIPLPPRQAAAILRPIADALGHIHDRGYVHCDVKPQNIFLRDNGTPALLDFGIARAEGSDTTALFATPHYLAPERVQGAPPTAAADLYALGIVLYHMVAGRPPFEGSAVPAIIQQHIEQLVPPLAVADPSARVLDRIIARLTAKRPEDRYSSTAELENDLATVEHSALHAQPTVSIAPMGASQPAVPVSAAGVRRVAPAPPPPRHAPSSQKPRAAWASAPTWRKRRWLAVVLVPLVLLLLGIGLARAGTSGSPDILPTSVPSPATIPASSPVPSPAAPAEVEHVAIPAIIGLPYDQAAALLTEQGLVVQRGEERASTDAVGVVLETDPPAAAAVAPGAAVTLHLSAGPAAAIPPITAPAPTDDERDDDDQDKDEDKDKDEDEDKDEKQDKDRGEGNDKKKD